MPSNWEEYIRWNEAIAETLFPEVEESRPVYLDLEDDSKRALGEYLSVPWDAVERELVSVVLNTMNLQAHANAYFGGHSHALDRWLAAEFTGAPPPVLPLLAVFSLAAERMSRRHGLSAANYYGRLNEVLGFGPDFNIRASYAKVAERFWGALNWWLDELDGSRGLPTARAVAHRHVGLSVSQALVRDADRDKLIDFFVTHGYPPGSTARPSELELALDSWVQQDPSPVSHQLRQLWKRKDERNEICNVVSNALQTWDGRVARHQDGSGAGGRRISLSVHLSSFPRKRFALTALAFLEDPGESREADLLSAGEGQRINLLPGIHSALSVGHPGDIDDHSLLEGILRIRDSRTGATAQRLPKRIVVFRKDALSNRMIEATQGVMLGEELVILIRDELKGPVLSLLTECARPGFEKVPDSYAGIPAGWTAVRGVEMFNSPDDSLVSHAKDLEALRPLSETNLVATAGLALPGLTRNRWHLGSPPELTAVSSHPDGFSVEVTLANEVVASATDRDGVAILPMADVADLTFDDYQIKVIAGNRDRTELTSMTVRLRDANWPDERQWMAAAPLFRPLDEPRALLSAVVFDESAENGRYLRGAVVHSPARRALLRQATVPATPSWKASPSSAPPAPRRPLTVSVPDSTSCVYSGAHHEVLPLVPSDAKGRPRVPYVVSKCKNCGMTRRYRTSWWAIQKDAARREQEAKRVVHDLASIQPRLLKDAEIEWDIALDALMHTGGGTWQLFERVANQIESSALFADSFARALESLGHLEIERDPLDLRPLAWEIAPSTLIKTANGYFLSGYWPGSRTAAAIEAVGLDATVHANPKHSSCRSWRGC